MAAGAEDPLLLITDFAANLHAASSSGEDSSASWRAMLRLLSAHREYRVAARTTLLRLFAEREQRRFYTESGLLPNSGFFSELRRRLAHKILPELVDDHDLKDCVHIIFADHKDFDWLHEIPADERVAFWGIT